MTDAIAISRLHKRFPGQSRDTLSDLSLTLPAGACLSLLGPSGCGKTTLLRLLMGLEQPTAGDIRIDPAIAPHMAYGFQEPRLVPWRTALENVLLPLELGKQLTPANRDYADELLARLGLDHAVQRFPRELSGGMQMRVALARALVTRPRLLLLDEPFAALDERTRFRLQDLLLELKTALALQYVFVTHSISESIYLGDYLLLLDTHGRERLFQPVDIGARNQDVKLSPAFIAVAHTVEQEFAAIERAA
jgi:NitT/TauT family transport system ATP-binding protein